MGATVQSTLKIFDVMSGPLKSITNSMNIVISSMQKMQNVTNSNMNIDKSLIAAKQQIASAEAEINRQINNSQQAQNNFNKSVNKGSSSMRTLGMAVIVVNQGVELLGRSWNLIEGSMTLADEMTAANARLALVNDGLRTQAQLQTQVLNVANLTRASYIDTAGLVTKLGAGTQGIFKNDDQLLKFAERFNKSLVISGATAVEASSAILQMSQALGSGVLQGDELRSLSETAPVLMRILSDGLGVARGQLKQMGADGKLTADKIVEAFQKQSAEIDKMYSKMPMTFGGAMTIMKNNFLAWYATLGVVGGPLSDITNQVLQLAGYLQSDAGRQFFDGIATGVATAIGWLMQLIQIATNIYLFFSDNWSVLGPLIWGIAGAVIGLTVAIRGAAIAQGIWNAVMEMNPLVLIITLVGAVILWLYKLWETNDTFAAGLLRVWNTILNFFNQVPIFFARVGIGIVNAFNDAKVNSLIIMENLVNGVIDKVNTLIAKLNQIPGVSINFVDGVSFSAESQIQAEAQRQAGEQKIAAMEKDAASKAVEREKKVQDMLDDRSEKRAKTEAEKQKKLQGIGSGTGTSLFSPNAPKIASVGKVDKVGKIEDKVDISSEDLKMMRELAEMKSIQNFVTLQPNVRVTTGDINSGADLNDIMYRIEQTIMEDVASAAAGVYKNG